jgi:hypothetical protein
MDRACREDDLASAKLLPLLLGSRQHGDRTTAAEQHLLDRRIAKITTFARPRAGSR